MTVKLLPGNHTIKIVKGSTTKTYTVFLEPKQVYTLQIPTTKPQLIPTQQKENKVLNEKPT